MLVAVSDCEATNVYVFAVEIAELKVSVQLPAEHVAVAGLVAEPLTVTLIVLRRPSRCHTRRRSRPGSRS